MQYLNLDNVTKPRLILRHIHSLESMQSNTKTTYTPAFPVDSLTINSLPISLQQCILKCFFLFLLTFFCGPIELKGTDDK